MALTLTPAQKVLFEEFLFERFQQPLGGLPTDSLVDFVLLPDAEQLTRFREWALTERSQVDRDFAGAQINADTAKLRLQQRGTDLDYIQTIVVVGATSSWVKYL